MCVRCKSRPQRVVNALKLIVFREQMKTLLTSETRVLPRRFTLMQCLYEIGGFLGDGVILDQGRVGVCIAQIGECFIVGALKRIALPLALSPELFAFFLTLLRQSGHGEEEESKKEDKEAKARFTCSPSQYLGFSHWVVLVRWFT